MIAKFKSNKIACIVLLIVCFIFISNPAFYSQSCLNGVSVWAFKLFPVLFPFFVLTKLIVALSDNKSTFLDKHFCKAFRSPSGSLQTFLLSTISGYPMGAKLICDLYEDEKISSIEAKKMFAYCSISGPMFMIGTVGVGMFYSYTAGIVILISNIIASLINGQIYKGKKIEYSMHNKTKSQSSNLLTDTVYNSLTSILMVGAFVVLSFLIIDILKQTGILNFLSNTICSVLKLDNSQQIVSSVLSGILEITRGINDLNTCNLSLQIKTIISSGLIGFGGFCILLQSLNFLSKIKIPVKTILLQKFTQSIFALIISIPLSYLFL